MSPNFYHLSPVSLTLVINLYFWIYSRIFLIIRNGFNGLLRGTGDTDSRKKPEAGDEPKWPNGHFKEITQGWLRAKNGNLHV